MVLVSAWPTATPPAVPPELLASALQAGWLAATGATTAGILPAQVTILAEGVLRTMSLAKIRAIAVLTLALTAFTLGGGVLTWQRRVAEPPTQAQPAPERVEPGSKPEVARVAEALRKNPARRPPGKDQLGLFLMDLTRRNATLIAAQAEKGRRYCGSPCWSHDGRRILFDASPGFGQWGNTRLQVLEVTEQGPRLRSLGAGNCPTISPDGERIAYLLNPEVEPGAEPGIHVMNADGRDRRRLGGSGIPKWSPDGRHLLTVSFSNPCQLTLLDVATGQDNAVRLPDCRFHSVPSWASTETIVAVVNSRKGLAIAVINVANPNEASIEDILWRRGDRLDPEPLYPVYSPATCRCVFVGRSKDGQALYAFQPGNRPQRLEGGTGDGKIAGLALSPDGRYLLFCSDRP
jgi:Tol biopolymer transport system component